MLLKICSRQVVSHTQWKCRLTHRHQLAQQQQQQQQGAAQGAGAGGNVLGAGGRGGGPAIDLAALRETPQIQQLRELIAQNPALIQPLIQQLASSNPAIAQAIAEHPQALFQLLGGEGGVDFGDGEGEEGGLPPGTHVVSVSEEERAAIERVSFVIFKFHGSHGVRIVGSTGIPSSDCDRGVFRMRQERGTCC
jgi:hypothetical protein